MKKARAYDPFARRARTLREKGITESQYAAMVRRQKGLCDICAKPLPAHPHVDHDHKTKRVRGLLDFWCNRFLGNNRNTPVMFRRAAAYLESRFDGRAIRPEEWP
jgi:hypothetical protein